MGFVRNLLAVLFILVAVILSPFIWIHAQMNSSRTITGKKKKRKPPVPLTEGDIANAERLLGFTLPPDLRNFYLSGQQRRRAPTGEHYSLKGAVKEYLMLMKQPYGPNGEDWPPSLFPFEDLLHGYAAYDLDSGLVTLWDPDEIAGGNQSRAAWKRSFQPTGESLTEYLAR